jgi:hypothetical protein
MIHQGGITKQVYDNTCFVLAYVWDKGVITVYKQCYSLLQTRALGQAYNIGVYCYLDRKHKNSLDNGKGNIMTKRQKLIQITAEVCKQHNILDQYAIRRMGADMAMSQGLSSAWHKIAWNGDNASMERKLKRFVRDVYRAMGITL